MQDLRKLGNIRKMSNLGGQIAYCLVSLQKLRLCQQQLKTCKTDRNFSSPIQFYWVTPFCSKYFIQDCRNVWLSAKYSHGMGICTFPDIGNCMCSYLLYIFKVGQNLGIVCDFPYQSHNVRVFSFCGLGIVWVSASHEIFKNLIILECFFFLILFPHYGNSLIPYFGNCMD